MPLTHLPPPTPVAAIHAAEVAEHADEYGQGVRDYLHALFAKLILPHTEWSRGTGQSATSTSVSANIGPSPQSTDINQAAFQTLGLPQTTPGVTGKAVLLAIALLKREPAPNWAFYFDGLLLKTVPQAVPLPPQPAEPAAPAAFAMVDLDEDNYQTYIAGLSDADAGLLLTTVDKVWRERWVHVTRFWYGTVASVQVAAKTASVALDPFPDAQNSVTQSCGFGARAWTAGQLQGRRVRVMWDRQMGWMVDDLA